MSEANGDWISRWEQGKTGFHQAEVNEQLLHHWSGVQAARAGRVLVPLCGKSLDLVWLRERGHEVVGFELSPLAVEQLFAGLSVRPEVSSVESFTVYRGPRLEIWQGDFFEATPALVEPCAAWFDRAAIVALHPHLRRRYVETVHRLLRPDASALVLTFCYPQDEMSGPPFSVEESALRQACEALFDTHLIDNLDLTDGNRWGLTEVQSTTFALNRLPGPS